MDFVNPLTLLTEDCWNHVLARVTSPLDRLSAANANSLFRKIMQFDYQENWTCMLFDMTLPHLFKQLEVSDLYLLRLMNKSFQKSVDNFLQNAETFRRINPRWDKRPKLTLPKFLNRRQESEMTSLSSVKIVGGALRIQFSINCLDCRPFLTEFGDQVFHLWLCISPSPFMRYVTEIMAFIRDVLQSTPNLTTIRLQDPGFTGVAGGWFQHDKSLVENFWDRNPLPELPNLEYLLLELKDLKWIHSDDSYGVYTMRALITAYASQFRYLNANSEQNLCTPMLLLESLKVEITDLKQLECLSVPRLKRIDVMCDKSAECLKILERFRVTLTHVKICSKDNTRNLNTAQLINELPESVDLPLLEELVLLNLSGCVGEEFPFLDNFPKLRRLEIEFEQPYKIRNVNVGKYLFSDFQKPEPAHFYNSSLWNRLPCLQILRVTAKQIKVTCYRHTYESLQNQKTKTCMYL